MITGIAGMERMMDKQIISLKDQIRKLKREKEIIECGTMLNGVSPYSNQQYDEICYSLDHAYDMLVSLTGDIMVDV